MAIKNIAKIQDQTSIRSHPGKVYDFFKSDDLIRLTNIVPKLFKKVKVIDEGMKGQPGKTLQYELVVFGDKVTIKLKANEIDDAKRSIIFSVVQENNNKKNMALMITITVSNGNIVWSLQFANATDTSEFITRYAKTIINIIIRALDIYLHFST